MAEKDDRTPWEKLTPAEQEEILRRNKEHILKELAKVKKEREEEEKKKNK